MRSFDLLDFLRGRLVLGAELVLVREFLAFLDDLPLDRRQPVELVLHLGGLFLHRFRLLPPPCAICHWFRNSRIFARFTTTPFSMVAGVGELFRLQLCRPPRASARKLENRRTSRRLSPGARENPGRPSRRSARPFRPPSGRAPIARPARPAGRKAVWRLARAANAGFAQNIALLVQQFLHARDQILYPPLLPLPRRRRRACPGVARESPPRDVTASAVNFARIVGRERCRHCATPARHPSFPSSPSDRKSERISGVAASAEPGSPAPAMSAIFVCRSSNGANRPRRADSSSRRPWRFARDWSAGV